jgi:hypothetical protein
MRTAGPPKKILLNQAPIFGKQIGVFLCITNAACNRVSVTDTASNAIDRITTALERIPVRDVVIHAGSY